MINAPFFSVVIVNYNHGNFLEEAIESVLNQPFTSYELIMVDGGSTDDSLKIISKYKSKFSWCVSEKDKGQSDAFNKGFNKAEGQFFFWLNADDILLEETLEKAHIYLSNNESCKWLACNTITMNLNREVKWCIKGPRYIDFLIKRGTVYVYGPTSIFHRDLFKLAGGFDEELYYTMDTDLWYRFVNLGYKFKRLNHYAWGLRIHEDSKTSHAFEGDANPKFEKEKIYIQKKNNHYTYKYIEKLLFLFKFFSGVFIYKYIDDVKLKNKKI